MKKILFSLAAIALLASCAKEPVNKGDNDVYSSDEASLIINFHYGTAGTKALSGLDNATTEEGKVINADFYFYDENGNYVARGTHATGWDVNGTTPAGNIESEKTSVITITGLKNKTQITQMLCVLNHPNGADLAQKSLKDVNAELKFDGTNGVKTYGAAGEFLMSTTAYLDGTPEAPFVHTVAITEENFLQEVPKYEDITTEEYKDKAVQIYVERVAAKVSSTVDNTKLASKGSYTDGTTTFSVYQIPYPQGSEGFIVDAEKEDLFLAISGWGLNATSKYYFPFKKLFENSAYLAPDYEYFPYWSASGSFRSYWEESPWYGRGVNVAPSEKPADADPEAYDLNYITYNQANVAAGGVSYCNPNTFKPWWITGSSAAIQRPVADTTPVPENFDRRWNNTATCVLVQTILLRNQRDAEGEIIDNKFEPATLYRGQGVLRTEANHLRYILSALPGYLPWKKVSTDPIKFIQAEVADFQTDGALNTYNIGDGYCGIYVNAAPTGSVDNKWYKADCQTEITFDTLDPKTAESNRRIFVVTETPDSSKPTETVTKDLSQTEVFNEGRMYYSIPIEHNLDPLADPSHHWYDKDPRTVVGDYGVVRNHFYSLTIKSVTGLGHGVYDPDVRIVPSDDVSSFYLGADIHVLSWQKVSQDVDLR
ncbi:MAG: Mfa1 fimbrilin C-terminal domain-containing protein [Bacteroidales bacterium]|nr:Mfa1 fimbrilin C-terminal domain-containing protein [Bacteroidales bacterium]